MWNTNFSKSIAFAYSSIQLVTWLKKIFRGIRTRDFYGTEQCVCKIWAISIFQNILQDHFEILYNFSLRKWKKNCSKMGAPTRGLKLLPLRWVWSLTQKTMRDWYDWLPKNYTINNFSKFQNDLAGYFEI